MTEIIANLLHRPEFVISLLAAGAVMLMAEIFGLRLLQRRRSRQRINRRLELLGDVASSESVIIELRRDRGMTDRGTHMLPFRPLSKLIVQSGVSIRGPGTIIKLMIVVLVSGAIGIFAAPSVWLGAAIGLVLALAAVLVMLHLARKRRHAEFGTQLPDVLDLIVRSLRAGHPIPVAVALVARESPDPIGTEFGIVSDEMTYGLGLEAALQNLNARVGQQDLPFLAVAVSIQSKTGGNLAEVLTNLSRVIRDRLKLRRRVTAMSSEGRLSATALSLIPVILFALINLIAPNFYGEIKNDLVVMPVVVLTFLLWATGIFVIYRLINFRY